MATIECFPGLMLQDYLSDLSDFSDFLVVSECLVV